MIRLHCISIIIPIRKLDAAYRGGFQQYKQDFPDRIERGLVLGGLDEDLFCISVMNTMDANAVVAELESYGLQEVVQVAGVKVCKDFCVCDILNGCAYRCEWLVMYVGLAAYLHRGDSYFKVLGDLCQIFCREQALVNKRNFNARLEEISTALKSPIEINDKLNEQNLFFTDKVTGQECEVVKSTFVARDRADALWKEMVPVYENLAREGNGEAYNLLGIIFQEEKERADEYFESGMVNGSAYAAFNLAMRTEDKKEKFALFLWASEHIVNADKQDEVFRGVLFGNLAKMYHRGIGTQPDRNEAERYYRMAMANHVKDKSVEDNFMVLLFEIGKKVEVLRRIAQAKDVARKMRDVHYPDKTEKVNQDLICYQGVSEQAIRLSLIADSYMDCIANLKKQEEVDGWNILLCGLPDLILDKDYVLNDFRPREETNSVLRLYARKRYLPHSIYVFFENFFGSLSFFRHITLPYTEDAIWQAFLLSQTYHLVGMRWHGGYEKRTFIVSDKDIAGLEPFDPDLFDSRKMHFVHLREQMLQMWTPDLCASIVLFDDYAIISHCWFDNWKGLSQVKWKVKYSARKKRIVAIEKESEQVLVEYHCGVWY